MRHFYLGWPVRHRVLTAPADLAAAGAGATAADDTNSVPPLPIRLLSTRIAAPSSKTNPAIFWATCSCRRRSCCSGVGVAFACCCGGPPGCPGIGAKAIFARSASESVRPFLQNPPLVRASFQTARSFHEAVPCIWQNLHPSLRRDKRPRRSQLLLCLATTLSDTRSPERLSARSRLPKSS